MPQPPRRLPERVVPLHTAQYFGKRAIDLSAAGLGLAFLVPLLVIIAIAVRLDSKGPIFFRQIRLGRQRRPFSIWKFRTMVVDAEERLPDLEHLNEATGGPLFKIRRDPRITRVGRILRRTSLDELPQLLNVLNGEMSLVGPRPLPARDSELLRARDEAGFEGRLQVLPGLTGPWQVGGRTTLDGERMVDLDLDYVANWSLTRDIVVLYRTIFVVLGCRGAY